MNNVLVIIDGNPLLGELDDFEISDKGYECIKSINEVVSYDEEMDYYEIIGHYAHQVLQFSVESLIESDTPELVKAVVETFGIKNFFADAFSEMIDNL